MKTRKTYLIAALLLLGCGLLGSCAKDRFDGLSNQSSLSFKLKTSESTGIQTKSNAQEHDIKGVYLLIFDRFAKFLECRPATFVSGDTYAASVGVQNDPVTMVAVANVAPLVESRQNSWVVGATTYGQIASELLTEPLRSSNGASIAMPELAPLFAEQVLPRIDQPMVVATPFVLERATAKLTISVSALNLVVFGANLYNVPTQGYVLPKQPAAFSLRRAPYMGSAEEMISTATEADPLYCYETPLSSDPAQHPFLVIKSNRGYYRINLTNSAGEQLSLQRNYWYRINLSQVASDGYPSADEAIRNPPLNVDIVVTDPNAHEIISNGVDYLGLSNSQYIIYDSYALNEFNRMGEDNAYAHYDTINGYVATILTYESRTAGEVTCVECTTESKGTQSTGIFFRNVSNGPWDPQEYIPDEWWAWQSRRTDRLPLPATTGKAISKKVIITIPHDFTSGKIKITLGTLEREMVIQRRPIISMLGEVLDLGSGYATAFIEFEKTFAPSYSPFSDRMPYVLQASYNNVDLIHFSNTPNGGWQKTLSAPSAGNLYIKVGPISEEPNFLYEGYPQYSAAASDFYLTRGDNQSRTKVHLIREPFMDGIKDTHPLGSPSYNYRAAFWRNDQSGERIIKVYRMSRSVYWTARVLYGTEFIRINHLDGRTAEEIQNGNAEDYQPDATWKTFIEQPYRTTYQVAYPQLRIGLTSKNTTGKPRYGLVLLSIPYAPGTAGTGQSMLIFVRQGEEPVALFSTSDTYKGAPRNYAQAFSPYLLTVPDPANHPGGPNFSDHKSMNGRGTFTQSPTQQGYIYQWGNDRAIHPSNPKLNQQIYGYTYDYSAPYQEVCPPGYTLPITDEQNIAYHHSFIDESNTREQMGLCADGYFDRFVQRNTSGSISVGTDGPELGVMGAVYYNTQTLASLFISDAATRPNGARTGSDYVNNDKSAFCWGRVVVPSSASIQALMGGRAYYYSSESLIQDRKGAFSVRCVKIDARHESGNVSTPGGGDYKPWN